MIAGWTLVGSSWRLRNGKDQGPGYGREGTVARPCSTVVAARSRVIYRLLAGTTLAISTRRLAMSSHLLPTGILTRKLFTASTSYGKRFDFLHLLDVSLQPVESTSNSSRSRGARRPVDGPARVGTGERLTRLPYPKTLNLSVLPTPRLSRLRG